MVVGRVLQLGGFWRDYIRDWGRGNTALHLYVVTWPTNLLSSAEPTQRRRTACGWELVVVVETSWAGVKRCRVRWWDLENRHWRFPFTVDDHYYALSRPTCAILMDTSWIQRPLTSNPQLKVSTTPHDRRTNEQIHHFLTPRAITHGACSHSPSALYFA